MLNYHHFGSIVGVMIENFYLDYLYINKYQLTIGGNV